MAKTPWTPEEDAKLHELIESGASVMDAAVALGRTYESTRMRLRYHKPRATVPEEERTAFGSAAADARVKATQADLDAEREKTVKLERQLAAAGTGLGIVERLEVTTNAEPPVDPAEEWQKCEADSERRINYYRERIRFEIDFEKSDPGLPVAVAFVSDQHISPGNLIDFRRMREDAELIASTPGLYACLGGDGVDNHIMIPSAILASRSQPHDQWQLYNWYLGIFAHKIMALISGNHDAWTDKKAGIDMVHMLAERQRICYSPYEARVQAHMQGYTYRIAFRHRYRFNSSLNLTHAVKRWWDMGEESFDVGCICHDHEAEVTSFNRHGLERWGVRPGAYQIGSSFVREFGWNQTAPTCPTIIMWPGERRMTGFNDIRLAAKFLQSERGTQ